MSDPIHATCIAIGDAGVLLMGPSGSGKSDLALRLIDRGALLVSDDYTALIAGEDELIATAPPTIAGKIEVRGVGILTVPHGASAVVRLVVQLTPEPPRLPDPETICLEGTILPLVRLDPSTASAPIKVELALAALIGAGS